MKIFFIKTFLFITPLLGLFFFIEYNLYKIPNSYNTKKKYFNAQKKDVEVLIVGSSHAYHGLNPTDFSSKAFNLATASQSIFYDTRLLTMSINDMPNLKLVIMDMSYFSFMQPVIDAKEDWRGYFYARFWDIDNGQLSLVDLKRYSMMALYTQKESIKYMKCGFKPSLVGDLQVDGYSKVDVVGDTNVINNNSGKLRAESHTIDIRQKSPATIIDIERNIKDIENIITKLKAKNIQVVFMTTPCYHTYYDNLNVDNVSFNDSVMRKIQSAYKVPYFDHMKDTRFSIADFMDNDHLNAAGGHKFSKIIDSEIVKPAVGKL